MKFMFFDLMIVKCIGFGLDEGFFDGMEEVFVIVLIIFGFFE